MKKKLFTVYVFSKINTKRFFRDRLALFFGILFPVIFLFVFGAIAGGNSSNVSFKVAVFNESKSPIASEFVTGVKNNGVFKVDTEVKNLNDANDKMSKSQLDAVIVLPANFGEVTEGSSSPSGQAKVVYTQNNEQAGQTITSVLDQQFKALNAQYITSSTPFTVASDQTNTHSLTAFDYTFAGLLGFAIVGIGIFGPVNVFPELKKQGILRRLHTTPLRVWQYFTSTMISQAIIGLVSLAVMFAVAIAVFHLNVVGNYFGIAVFLTFSIVAILGIGLAIGGWAKNERQAAPLANIIVFPMLFLSGTFFPRFLMPEWLQQVSQYLPLTPIIDGARLIVTEGKTLLEIGPQLGLMALWTIVIYIIAFRVFRWE
jgi:ABC-2 type transport system permease protein